MQDTCEFLARIGYAKLIDELGASVSWRESKQNSPSPFLSPGPSPSAS